MLLDLLAHLFKLDPRSNVDTADDADARQRFEDAVLGMGAAQEADDGDDALHLDGLQALSHGPLAADLNDMIDALLAGSQLASGFTPVRVLAVVDDVVGAELLEDFGFLGGRGGRDDGGARGFGELGAC